MSPVDFWRLLDIQPSADLVQIRSAYARKLKATNPEDDAESFQLLRQAYEEAVRFVESRSVIEEDDRGDDSWPTATLPAGVPEEPVCDVSSRQAVLRAFGDLAAVVSNPDSSEAHLSEAFAVLLQCEALNDLSVRLDLEVMLAELLLDHVPRTRKLIVLAASSFGWSTHKTAVNTHRVVLAAAECADDMRFLGQLAEGRHSLAGAYRTLIADPTPVWLTLRSWVTGIDKRVAELLQIMRFDRRYTSVVLNERAVAWWLDYLSQPQLSHPLVAMALIVPLPLAIFCWSQDMTLTTTWSIAGLSMLVILLIAALKLCLIDRVRLAFRNRWPPHMQTTWRVGWAGLSAVVLLVAIPRPSNRFVAAAAVLAATVALLWSWYSSRDPIESRAPRTWTEFLLGAAPLMIWAVALVAALPLWIAMIFTLVAAAGVVGEAAVEDLWYASVPSQVRLPVYVVAVLATAAWTVLLLRCRDESTLYGFLCAGILAIALAQRIALVSLTERQKETRFKATFTVLFSGAYITLATLKVDAVIVIGIGAWISLGGGITFFMASINEFSRRRTGTI